MRYRIVYEKAPRNYGAYSPDLPGCVAMGSTLDACRRLMRQGIELYLEESAKDGSPRPRATGYLEILDFPPAPTRPPRAATTRRVQGNGRATKPRKKAAARTG